MNHRTENADISSKYMKDVLIGKAVQKTVGLPDKIALGVKELHEIGFAHCDISLNNIFVEFGTNVVFLDDLEYLTPILDKPPHLTRISFDLEPATATLIFYN